MTRRGSINVQMGSGGRGCRGNSQMRLLRALWDFCLTFALSGDHTAALGRGPHLSDMGYDARYPIKADRMLAHRYKVWSWGNERTDGQDDVIKYNAGLTVVAKRHRHEKFEVFNELVAMHLGRALGVPVPVGFVVEKDNEPFYCSGNIAIGDEFPDADLEHLAINQPRMMCGIALFDGWICNHDRHAANIFYDTDSGRVWLVDHGQAVLGILGPKHLRQDESCLCLRDEFASEVRDCSSFPEWYERLMGIPDRMILDAVKDAAAVGIGETDALVAGSLLIARRLSLRGMFRDSCKSLFPKFAPCLFPPFEAGYDSGDFTI